MGQRSVKRKINQHLVIGGVYLMLALLLTWPTISHLTSHLPGDGGDDPAIAWNLWWVKQALLVEGQTPFYTDRMFYPLGINLAYYTLTVLNAVTALPFTLNFSVVTASNLHMLFTFVVGGYGTFLLVRYLLLAEPSPPGPLSQFGRGGQGMRANLPLIPTLAGGFYAFASSKLFYIALGQFNIGSSHWIPFVVLYVLRMHHQPNRLKNAFMAGLFLTLQAWSELTYASFLLIFIALYWLYWLTLTSFLHLSRQQPRRPSNPPTFQLPNFPPLHLRSALLLILTFALGLSPILAHMLPDMLTEGDFLVEGGGFATAFSADLLGFLIPTMHHPLLGHLVSQTAITDYTLGQHIYVGLVLLGLVAVSFRAIIRQPTMRFWLFAAVIFALLCLGPTITVNGHDTGLRGPFVILQQLPFFKGNRYPSRYSVMLLLSLSLLAGFSLNQLSQWLQSLRSTRRLRPAWFLALIGLIFLFEHLSAPLPQSDMRVPPAYATIAADPAEVTVLDIPFAWRNGFSVIGAQTTQFMFGQFYQTSHQKPLLQGNTSRNPAFKFQYFVTAPIINSLLALQIGQQLPPERLEHDRTIAAEVLRFFNISYIVVRPYHYEVWNGTQTISVTEQAVIPYIEEVLPIEKIFDEAGTKVYRVLDLEAKVNIGFQTDTASFLAPLHFGEGWGIFTQGQPLTAQRQRVRLMLPLSNDPQQITLRLRLPETFGDSTQTARLEINGWRSPPQPVSHEWHEMTFEVPASVAQTGLTNVWLRFDEVTTFPEFSAEHPLVDVTVLSAGTEVGGTGGLGHIFINGYDVSANKRGYNAVQITPDGTTHSISFDTNFDPAASAGLTEFIQQSPPDAVIALAVADEASQNLSEAAVQTLQSLGANGDLRGCFRCSHALIRQADGTVLERLDPLKPVGLTTNLGLTKPSVAAQLEWIRVEPVEE